MSCFEDLYPVDESADRLMNLNSPPTHVEWDAISDSYLPIDGSVNMFPDHFWPAIGTVGPLPPDYEEYSSSCINSNYAPSSSSTPSIRRRVAPLPRPAEQAISRAQLDHTSAEGPVTKKVKSNSTFAADEWAYFNPTDYVSVVPTQSLFIAPSLLNPMDESSPEPPSTQASRKSISRKRKFSGPKEEDCKPEEPVKQVKWEKRDNMRSVILNKGKASYRCDLCSKAGRYFSTKTQGDLTRHIQSLAHSAKSFECTTPGCGKVYTRTDSLKRHQRTIHNYP